MKIRKGPRPLTIHLFAAAFLASAVIAYLGGLWGIEKQMALFEANVPELDWSEDAVIVILSARLSIAFIPVALVWLFASRVARWLVTVLGLGKLINVPQAVELVADGEALDPTWTASLVLALLAVAMLFLPASNRWFALGEEIDPATFD